MSGIHVSNTDDIFFAILKELKPDSSPPPYIFIFISYKTQQQPP